MEILERLQKLIDNGTGPFNMIEFGACDGYHTKIFIEMLNRSKRKYQFDSFEPETSNFKIAERAIMAARPLPFDSDHIVRLWPFAVGSEPGEQTFYVSGGQKMEGTRVVDRYYGSSSIRAPKLVTSAWPLMTFHTDRVQVYSLDSMKMLSYPIDFIWADIQGAAGDMILGGKETFKRVRNLYVEYDNSELYEGEVLGVDAVVKMLPDFEVVEDYGGDVLLTNKSAA